MRKMDVMDGLFLVVIGALAVLGAIAYAHHSPFFKDSIISIAIVALVYPFRNTLLLSVEGTALAGLAWIINAAGAIGAYDLYWNGIGWDKLLHLTSTVALAILVYTYLRRQQLSTAQTIIITFLVIEGLGAVNEVAEFIGTQYFGVTQGLFGMSNGTLVHNSTFDIYDTQWDMIANTLGATIGITYQVLRQPKEVIVEHANPEQAFQATHIKKPKRDTAA